MPPGRFALRGGAAASAARRVQKAFSHSHSHEHMSSPGSYAARATGAPALWATRDFAARAFTVGIGGPVGSGKTALTLALCARLRDRLSLGVVTNDIFTREDAEFLVREGALEADRIAAVETGGCPHQCWNQSLV